MIPMRPGSMKFLMLLSAIAMVEPPVRRVRAQGLEEDSFPEPLRASDLGPRDNELPAGPIPFHRPIDHRLSKLKGGKFEGTVKPKSPSKKSRAERKKSNVQRAASRKTHR